jgi:hypothetical protein
MGPMGHPRVEIHTRPRPGLLRVRVWVHPRVRFDTHGSPRKFPLNLNKPLPQFKGPDMR